LRGITNKLNKQTMKTYYLDRQIKLLKQGVKNNTITLDGKEALSEYISIKEQLTIYSVVVPKGTVCGYCNDTGWDSYPNHDTTPRPCPECQP
jgi:5-methylcytosine-specific restriction endonuclease McrA